MNPRMAPSRPVLSWSGGGDSPGDGLFAAHDQWSLRVGCAPVNARLGIDLGGTKIAGVVLDADDRVLAAARVTTPQGDYHATMATVVELVHKLEHEAGTSPLPVGIGTPGSVIPATGCMRNCNSQCLNGQTLPRDLQSL